MKIRDGFATINGDTTEHELPSDSLEIIADDGKSLLRVSQQRDGSIRIHAGYVCKHGGKILDDRMLIRPIAGNVIEIIRPVYPF
jgi:hypothetical protein